MNLICTGLPQLATKIISEQKMHFKLEERVCVNKCRSLGNTNPIMPCPFTVHSITANPSPPPPPVLCGRKLQLNPLCDLPGHFSGYCNTIQSINPFSPGFQPLQCGDRLYTSESDVCRRQILTYKDGPRTERIEKFLIAVDPYHRYESEIAK